jgi:hypothetical protein
MGHIAHAKGVRLGITSVWYDTLPINKINTHIQNKVIDDAIYGYFNKIRIRRTGTILYKINIKRMPSTFLLELIVYNAKFYLKLKNFLFGRTFSIQEKKYGRKIFRAYIKYTLKGL